jgi:hypothetical protein
MLMNKLFIFSVITALIFTGCGTKKTENVQDNVSTKYSGPEPVKFTAKELFKSVNNCKPGERGCTYIRITYLEAAGGPIKDKLNSLITGGIITAYEMPDKNLNNPQLMMDTYIKDFEAFKKKSPQAAGEWTVDFDARVYAETDKILSLAFENSSFLGGAHPSVFMAYRNVSKETGDTISLSGLFGNGFEDKLNAMIDKKYREMRGLKPGDNLREKGDLFNSEIKFNYNFAVTADKGIEFYYNAYEIAPYVVGPIVVKLSGQEAASIITGASPLK